MVNVRMSVDEDVVASVEVMSSRPPPAVTVSRAVQQLLERHGLACINRSNGGGGGGGAFVQVNNNNSSLCQPAEETENPAAPGDGGGGGGTGSESDLDSDWNEPPPIRRPDPIGGFSTNGRFGHGLDFMSSTETLDSSSTDVNGNNNNNNNSGGDAETEELSKLRCQSVRTEVLAEKFRRKNRCADYPGFAFASSVFSSDTMMKFNIIKNELHNIMNNQLKRVRLLHVIHFVPFRF